MHFLPKTILDKNDLKKSINSLMLEEETLPKATLTKDLPPGMRKPLPKKEEEKKEENKEEKKEE